MNVAHCAKESRPALSVQELLAMFAFPPGPPLRGDLEAIAIVVSEPFDDLTHAEALGLYVDTSAIAADLQQPFAVRRLAACVARVAESAAQGPVDWEIALDWVEAAEYARHEGLTRPERS